MLTKKILMSLAVLLGLLVIGEAGSRLIWSVSDLSLSPENAHLIDHPTRLWVQAPNARFQLPEHGALVTNELGLRDDPVRIPKPASEHRILSLGESSTWGHGVRREETYSAQLETMLSQAGRTVNVINAGVPAWTIQQSAVYLAEEGARLQPDTVLIYHQTNDFLPTGAIDTHNPLVKLTTSDRGAHRASSTARSAAPCAVRQPSLPGPSQHHAAHAVGPPEGRRFVVVRCGCRARTVARRWIACAQAPSPSEPGSWSCSRCTPSITARTRSFEIGVRRTTNSTSRPQTFVSGWGGVFRSGFFPTEVHPRPQGHRLIAERIAERLP